MAIDLKLVRKGKDVPLVGLRDQLNVHGKLEADHREELKSCGWTDGHGEQLQAVSGTLEGSRADQLEARDGSRAATADEGQAISEAKSFKRKLDRAVDDLAADDTLPIPRSAFHAGRPLGRNTARIVSYLADVQQHVLAIDKLLEPYFQGKSAAALLVEVKTNLESRQAIQEVALDSLPEETLKIYEAKGKALQLIEKMNRIASIRFDGDAATIALFNKDLILRARKTRRTKPAAGEATGEPTA